MLTSSELKKIPIFSCLNDANLMWLSQQAADFIWNRVSISFMKVSPPLFL
jgi:hypothetical protein